jgi:hypothetical protein
MTKRALALLFAISAAAFVPLGFVLSGCASIPWEKRAIAVEKAICLANAEGLAKAVTTPGYAKALRDEADAAYKRVMETTLSGREPDMRDLKTLDEARSMIEAIMECL